MQNMALSRDSVKASSWFLAIGVVFFYLVIGRIYFVTNDDSAMVQIISGARSEMYRDMPVFCNTLLAKCLVFLYDLYYPVNWFVVLSCLLSLVCLVWINICILQKHFSVFAFFLCLILDIVIGEFHFFRFQFTHNAYLFSICGLLAILHGCRKPLRENWHELLFGIIAVAMGCMIRFNAFCLSLFLCAGWTVYQMAISQDSKIKFRMIAALFVVIMLTSGLWLYNKQCYCFGCY